MYECKSGLWQHSKLCIVVTVTPPPPVVEEVIIPTITNTNDSKNIEGMMLKLKKLNDSIVVLSKDLNSRHTVPVVNNISNNKIFNINVFLNETCKNAINLDSFVSDDAGMRHFQFLDVQKPQHHTQSTGWFLFEY